MPKFRTTPALLLCAGLLLQVPAIQADEALNFVPIPQQTLLDYLAGKNEMILLDARSPEEFEAGHIWGASNLPVDADPATSEVLPANLDAELVVYCKSGKRAEALQQKLLALGYNKVRVLAPAQMLWAGELPVFNCGADAPGAPALVTVDNATASAGDKL